MDAWDRKDCRPSAVRWSWLVAVALSLAIHGTLALALVFLPAHNRAHSAGSIVLDTRVAGQGVEVRLALLEDPPRRPTPLPAPPKNSEPARTHSTASQNASTSSLPSNPPSHGSLSNEQEERTGTGSRPASAMTGADRSTLRGTTFFQISTDAQRIVYVLDRSASMGISDSFTVARRELLASLRRLPASASFQVIVYNRLAESLWLNGSSQLAMAIPANVAEAGAQLARLETEGGTNHLAALKLALSLSPDVIYFLTDGADLRPDQIRQITMSSRGRSIIHAIDMGSPRENRGANTLRNLAEQTHGQYVRVASMR